MADTSNLSEFLTDIADAIRTKKETTEQIPAASFDTEILSIEAGMDTSDATATADDIISPKTAYAGNKKITGKITAEYAEYTTEFSSYDLPINIDIYTAISGDGKIIVKGNRTNKNIDIYVLENNRYNLKGTFDMADYITADSIVPLRPAIQVSKFGIDNDENKCLLFLPYTVTGNINSHFMINVILYDKITNNFIQKSAVDISEFRVDDPMSSSIYEEDGVYPIYLYSYTRDSTNYYNSYGIIKADADMNYTSTIFGTNTMAGGISYRKQNLYAVNNNIFIHSAVRTDRGRVHTSFGTFNSLGEKVIKQIGDIQFIPNKSLTYAIVDGVLKSCSYNPATFEFGYTDLEKQLSFFDRTINNDYRWLSANIVIAINYTDNKMYMYKIDLENITKTLLYTFTGSTFNNVNNIAVMGNVDGAGNKVIVSTGEPIRELFAFTRNNQKYISSRNTTAASEHILANRTAYSNDGFLYGTMSDNGELNYVPSTEEQAIPAGYTSGGIIQGDSNLISENIKKGVTIFGVEGTYEPDYTELGTISPTEYDTAVSTTEDILGTVSE